MPPRICEHGLISVSRAPRTSCFLLTSMSGGSEGQPDLPGDVDRIGLEWTVATDEPGLFSFRLGNGQTVERITVVQRQFIQDINVPELHSQNPQIIGRLLPVAFHHF